MHYCYKEVCSGREKFLKYVYMYICICKYLYLYSGFLIYAGDLITKIEALDISHVEQETNKLTQGWWFMVFHLTSYVYRWLWSPIKCTWELLPSGSRAGSYQRLSNELHLEFSLGSLFHLEFQYKLELQWKICIVKVLFQSEVLLP